MRILGHYKILCSVERSQGDSYMAAISGVIVWKHKIWY